MILFNDVISEIDRCPVCNLGVTVSNEWVRCALDGNNHFIAYCFYNVYNEPHQDIVDQIRIYLPRIEWECFTYHRNGAWLDGGVSFHTSDDLWALMRRVG